MEDVDAIIISAKAKINEELPEEALVLLEKLDQTQNSEVLFLKGEICFKLEKWGEALNHFSFYHEQFPDNKKAVSYISMIQNILGFFHRDLLNP